MIKKFKNIEDSQLTITELMLPSHSNFSGKIHGGHILNLMDQIAFACASKHSSNYCVTASVNKVDFLNPIEVGELNPKSFCELYRQNFYGNWFACRI
jgi:acyl-CoA hydrolase